MTTKDSLREEVEQLKATSEGDDEFSYYEHPDTGRLYNRFKQPVDEPKGIVIHYSWYMAPFVVEREKAEAEGWQIVDSVTADMEGDYYNDLVEVSEWCVNPWVNNPDDRKVISE